VCGEPAWDPEFDTADFFMLLRSPGSALATHGTSSARLGLALKDVMLEA